ncbi:MAG: ATP-binding cassette domain-containing protein [Brevinematales bacterium]|nr:ATP-binding cassette domain-containing protein [Brevinematales bacterium]
MALFRVKNLKKYFTLRGSLWENPQTLKAVDGVSFDLYEGETLAVVGESGCGKSTLARTMIRLHEPTEGELWFEDRDLVKLDYTSLRLERKHFQMIFQDPYASLNPRMTIGDIIAEPMEIFSRYGVLSLSKAEIRERVGELLHRVGLSPSFVNRYPHEFSGGQRQRIGIARALALNPQLILCDEPVSALDVSIQSQILNLLEELQQERKLTYLFISHDLAVVKHISTRVAVMYLGKIVELAKSQELYERPFHPYARALLSDVPIPDPRLEKQRKRILLKGDVPSPIGERHGCPFKDRCYMKTDICEEVIPPLEEKIASHFAACHHWEKCANM